MIKLRMIKKKNFWDFQKKKNRSYFKHIGATVKTKGGGQIVTIKQERALLSRFNSCCSQESN